MNANTILVNFKMVGDISDVKSNVSQLQNVINKIDFSKMGKTSLKTSLVKNFSDIEKEISKIQGLTSKGFNDKGSVKQLESSYTNLNRSLMQLQSNLGKVSSSDIQKVFNVDTSGLKTLTDQLQQAQNKLQTLNAAPLEKIKTNLETLSKQGRGKKTIPIIQGLLEDFNKADSITEKSNLIQQAIDKVQSNLNRTTKESNRSLYQGVSDQLTELQKNLNSIDGQKITELFSQIQNFSTAELEKTTNGFQKLSGMNLTNLINGVQNLSNKTVGAATKTAQMNSELGMLESRVGYFFSLANGVQLFRRAVQQATNTVKTLDKTMTEAAVVTQYSVGDMWDKLPEYTSKATALGAEINDLYKATTLYYQQGLKTNEAMGVGVETMKMARIAGMEASEATKGMTAAIRGFKMAVDEASATRVNDVYSVLAANTASNTQEISTAMSKTASIAANANMEFETTAALLAQIIETTQEAPETAGTAMKTIIARFSEVKKLFSEGDLTGTDEEGEVIEINKIDTALRSVGLSLKNFLAGREGIDDVFLQLAERWDSIDLATQRYIATVAAGSRQQSRFIAMMSDYKRTMELVDLANNSAGASQDQFNKTMDSLESKINQLKNAWNEFLMNLANNDFIKGAIDLISNLLKGINKLIDGISGGNGLVKSLLSIGVMVGGLKIGKTIFGAMIGGVARIWHSAGVDAANGFSAGVMGGLKNTATNLKNFWRKMPKSTEFTKSITATAEAELLAAQRHSEVISFRTFKTKEAEAAAYEAANARIAASEEKLAIKKAAANAYNNASIKTRNLVQALQTQGIVLNAAEITTLDKLTGEELENAVARLVGEEALEKENREKTKAVMLDLKQRMSNKAAIAEKLKAAMTTLFSADATAKENAMKALGIKQDSKLFKIISKLPGPFMAYAAAIMIAVAALVALAKARQEASLEGRLKNAEEASKKLGQSIKTTKENIDKLGEGSEAIDEINEKINNAVKGTLEWNKAILELNNKIYELSKIDSEILVGATITDGAIQLRQGALEQAEQKQIELELKQFATQMNVDQAAERYRVMLEAEDFVKEFNWGLGNYLDYKDIFTTETSNEYYQALVNYLEKKPLGEIVNATDEELIKIGERLGLDINSKNIDKFKDSLVALDNEAEKLTAQQELVNSAIAEQIIEQGKLEGSIKDVVKAYTSSKSDELQNILDTTLNKTNFQMAGGTGTNIFTGGAGQVNLWGELSGQTVLVDAINEIRSTISGIESNLDYTDVLKEYTELMGGEEQGWRVDEYGFIERQNEKGEWENVNIQLDEILQTMKGYYESEAGAEEFQKVYQETSKELQGILAGTSLSKDSGAVDPELINRLLSGKLTIDDISVLSLDGNEELLVSIQETLTNHKFNIDVEATVTANKEEIEKFKKYFDSIGLTLDNITVDSGETIQKLLRDSSVLGGQDELIKILNSFENLSASDLEKIIDQINQLDFTDIYSIEGLSDKLKGVLDEEVYNKLINKFDELEKELIDVYNATKKIDFSKITDELINSNNILTKVQAGELDVKVLSEEDMKSLIEMSETDTIDADSFERNIDGTWALKDSQEQLIAAIQENTRAVLGEGGSIDQLANAQEHFAQSGYDIANLGYNQNGETLYSSRWVRSFDIADYLANYYKGDAETLIAIGAGGFVDENGQIIKDANQIYNLDEDTFDTNIKALVDSILYGNEEAIQLRAQAERFNAQTEIGEGNYNFVAYDAIARNDEEASKVLEEEATRTSGYDIELQRLIDLYGYAYEEAKDFYNASILDSNKAIKATEKFADSMGTLVENFEEGITNGEEYSTNIDEVAKNMSDIFGLEIDSAFVQKNIDTIVEAYKSGNFEELNNLVSEQLRPNSKNFPDIMQSIYDIYKDLQLEIPAALDTKYMYDALNRVQEDINNAKASFAIGAEADLTNVINELIAAGMTAESAMALIGKIEGITVEPVTEMVEVWSDMYGSMTIPKTTYKVTGINEINRDTFKSVGGGGSSSGGGGGSEKEEEKPEKWKNEYDYFYNTTEALNEALREREKLERKYDRLLKNRKTTAEDLIKNSQKEIEALQKQIDLNTTLQKGRLSQLKNVGNETYRGEDGEDRSYASLGVTRYARYDESLQQIVIDWQGINQITDNELGSAVSDYISRLEELQDQFEETQDQIEDIQDQIEEIQERGKEEYLDFEQTIYDALVQREQKVIDEFQQLSDTINNTNSNILNALQESVDLERQIRDNTKTEDEIADMEARLSYLRMDTSGANALEILELEKQLAEKREGYQDNLVDQEIDRLGKINDDAAEQRERQISIMQAQLDYQAENGYYWNQVTDLINRAWGSNGEFNVNSDLARLLQETEAYKSMSEFGRLNWINELIKRWNTSLEGYSNLKVEQLQQAGTTAGNKVIDNSGMDLGTLEYNANNRIWQNNQTGEGYTSLSYDKESNQFTASGYTDAYVQGFLQHVPGNGKNLTTQEIKWLQRGLNRMFINEVGDLAGIPGEQRIGITGQYDKATEDKVKRLQWRLGITQNGLWDEVTKAKFDSMEYAKRFKTGGLADFTGPAWLDGTKSKPEIVLNQQDSQNFIQLKDILSEVLNGAPDAQKTNNGDNYFDIQIHVDELSNDYDVDQLSDKIRRDLYNDGMYRNVNTIHLSR